MSSWNLRRFPKSNIALATDLSTCVGHVMTIVAGGDQFSAGQAQ